MNKFKISLILLLVLFIFSGCEIFTETHTLTIEMEGNGMIVDEDKNIILDSEDKTADIQINDSATITLIAEPKTGSILSEWQGELIEKVDNKVKIQMNRNKKVKVVYSKYIQKSTRPWE